MAEWKTSPDWAWEYSQPPYRGVLVTVYLQGSGCVRQFTVHIETPRGRHCAPDLFDKINDAKTWVEQEIEHLMAGTRADDESPS